MPKFPLTFCAILYLASQASSAGTIILDANGLSGISALEDVSVSVMSRAAAAQVIATANRRVGFSVRSTVTFSPKQLVFPVRLQADLSSASGLSFLTMDFDLPRTDASNTVTLVAAPIDPKVDGVNRLRSLYALDFSTVGDIQLQRYFQEVVHLAEVRLNRRSETVTGYDLRAYLTLLRVSNQMIDMLDFVPPEQVRRARSALKDALRLKNPQLAALPPMKEVTEIVQRSDVADALRYKKLWEWIGKQNDCVAKIDMYEAYLELYQAIPTRQERTQIEQSNGITTDYVLAAQRDCVVALAQNIDTPASVVNSAIASHVSAVTTEVATGLRLSGAVTNLSSLTKMRRR